MIFCFIKSRANRSGFTQPFLNPNLINAPNSLSQIHLKESKQNFGEFEYFGGSDVANTLIECEHISFPDIFYGIPPPKLMGSLVL